MRALSLRNKILLGYLLPTALTVAASVLVYRTLVVSIATGEQVSRTSQVIAYANVAIRSVVEAEAGARAFASVGDAAGLQRYNDALRTFDKISRRLSEMARDRPGQLAHLDRAKEIATRRVSDVAAPLIAARRLTPAGLAHAGDRLLVAVLQLRTAEPTAGADDGTQAAAFRNQLADLRLELERALRLMPNDFERWVRLGTLASDYEAACVRRTADRHARGADLEALAASVAQRNGAEKAANDAMLAEHEPRSARAGLDPFRAEMGEFVEKETESLDEHRRASDAAVQTGKIVAIAGPGLAAALALILGLVLSLGIVRSVRSVASAAQALMAGNTGQRARADANDEIGVMAQTFNVMADGLAARNREAALLSQFGGLLSACTTLDEAYRMIERLCRQLLPANSGALYVAAAGQKSVERVAAWGDAAETLGSGFAPEDCWAIRRGKSHLVAAGADGIPCAHVAADPDAAPAGGHVCIPIMAQGELLSVLCVRFADGARRRVDEELRLAGTVAEPVALALANLRLRERLQNQSIRDPLTGLFNRRFLNETFAKELSSARRHKRGLGVMVIDVDHFKRFNDTFGHAAGDTLLAAVGKLLAGSFRNEDIVCRFGGEEFVVLLPYAGLEDTARRADELRVAISRLKLQHQGTALGPITASLGVAAFPVHGHDEATLIGAADAALYEAKHAGRNRVVTAPAPDLPGSGASAGAAQS
jgi:diguanylate cyclase (GGDEF)-like protein